MPGAMDAFPRFLLWLASAAVMMLISSKLRATLLKLKARERELQLKGDELGVVVKELEHRGRNALAVIQALSNQAVAGRPVIPWISRDNWLAVAFVASACMCRKLS